MTLKRYFLTILLSSSYLMAGGNNSIGTPGSIIERLELEGSRYSKSFSLRALDDESIDLAIEDYHFEDGYLAIHGNATSDFNSSFMLKGTEESISGYIAFHDTKEAYRYKTGTNGKVQVEKVDIDLVHPTCEMHPPEDYTDFYIEQPNWGNGASEPHIGKYPGTNVNKLQSLPGAKKVFYLDITRIMNGDNPVYLSKAEIWQTWQSVASSLSMYELNVTTDPEVYKKAGIKNSGIARFLNQDGRSNAPLNSFGTASFSRNYKQRNGYGLGRIAAHEIGHQLGLHHDRGNPGGEYFTGFPEFKWTPVMGNIWPGDRWGDQALYQWSKSEYASGTNKQDDLKVMQKYLKLRKDDIETSKSLVIKDGKVDSSINRGQIGFTTDTDSFDFEVAEENGEIDIKIDRIEYLGGAMLDVHAEILDSMGKTLAKSNPKAKRYAEFETTLKKGKYTLLVKGGAEGTPQKGFSNYSSLGFYGVEGSISGTE